jgi:hypothetical protein
MRLVAALWCATALALTLAACGGSEPEDGAAERRETAPRRETVFDPLTSTIDRAEGVQRTVDQQAAEQRRRIEDAER